MSPDQLLPTDDEIDELFSFDDAHDLTAYFDEDGYLRPVNYRIFEVEE